MKVTFSSSYEAAEDRYQQMVYRRCGHSGVLLPPISLGFWQIFGHQRTYEDIAEMVLFAFDQGVCHFDLANNYGPVPPGIAETNFGRMMSHSLAPYRDELFISTKAGYEMWPGPYGNWGSRKYLISSLDQSLKRMNLEYVDLFYIHRWDPETPLEETLQALVDIVHAGKALYVGISKFPHDAALRAFEYLEEQHIHCLAVQDRYNIIDRQMEAEDLFHLMRDYGVGFTCFSPLQQGLLTKRYLNGVPPDSRMAQGQFLKESMLTEEMLTALRGLNDLAQQRRQSLAQMALSWVLDQPQVTSAIIGASSMEQLKENLQAVEYAPFSDEEKDLIEKLSRPIQIRHWTR